MPIFGWNSQEPSNPSQLSDSQSPHSTQTTSDHHPPQSSNASNGQRTPVVSEQRVKQPDVPEQDSSKPPSDSNLLSDFPSSFNPDKKEDNPSSFVKFPPSSGERSSGQPSSASMPHRVESFPMPSGHRRHPYENPHRRHSPPPIVTLTNSPSSSVASLDRSSVSTPPMRRSPPHTSMQAANIYSAQPYPSDPSLMQPPRHHISRGDSITHGYMYNTHTFDQRYEPNDGSNQSPYHGSAGLPPHLTVPAMTQAPANYTRETYSHPYPLPGQASVNIVHTDDAATKLSDRIRRRCFNCCTTDTSTWRRSNLSPGKVLCNKCGLFERTHQRPRPDQFPHKRGPLATSTLRSRTPPSTQLPPISPPYHYSHPSIAPLNTVQDARRDYQSNTLPGLQTWHSETGSPHMQPLQARRPLEPTQHTRPQTPPSARPAQDSRDSTNNRESGA